MFRHDKAFTTYRITKGTKYMPIKNRREFKQELLAFAFLMSLASGMAGYVIADNLHRHELALMKENYDRLLKDTENRRIAVCQVYERTRSVNGVNAELDSICRGVVGD